MKVFLKFLLILLPLLAGLSVMNSCHKELFTNRGGLSFSADTLTFDTVFTTLGSVTKSFTVRNTQSKAINITDIKLMQLAGTQFRISIPPNSPVSGTEYKNISIPAHDSIYIYVEVTINPNTANNPFVIFDEIQFVTNGVTQDVVLEAMGQNAHYYFSYQVLRNTTFTFPTDKPNIVVNKNGALPIFAVDTGATCIIPPGCKIFMGPGAVMTVDGTLMTSPTPTWSDSIIFQYIRTDYPGQPGLWLGITYSRIATINLSHVIIDQSTFGISDEYVLDVIAQSQITTSNLTTSYSNSQLPNVNLDKVIIRNTSSSAMTALCTNLNATNCLFYSCGGGLVQLGFGGTCTLNNCTLANIYSSAITSQNQALAIVDDLRYINNVLVPPLPTTVNISNTIVGGNTSPDNGNDVYIGLVQPSSDHVTFNTCFLTTTADSITAYQAINNGNIDTLGDPYTFNPAIFNAPYSGNYMPDSGSLVFNAGNATSADLYDNPRPSSHSSIGAIQWHH